MKNLAQPIELEPGRFTIPFYIKEQLAALSSPGTNTRWRIVADADKLRADLERQLLERANAPAGAAVVWLDDSTYAWRVP
jgi:hypothetical protein